MKEQEREQVRLVGVRRQGGEGGRGAACAGGPAWDSGRWGATELRGGEALLAGGGAQGTVLRCGFISMQP